MFEIMRAHVPFINIVTRFIRFFVVRRGGLERAIFFGVECIRDRLAYFLKEVHLSNYATSAAILLLLEL